MMGSLKTVFAVALMACGLGVAAAPAAELEVSPPHLSWQHTGIFGTFDRAAVQRGFQVYKEVCSNCHALGLLTYRDLDEVGFPPDQVKAIAASVAVTDGPNDQGEMFQRPGKPSDRFVKPYPNDQAARAANNGALPPDLSLIAKAREGGEDYIAALLTGYDPPPEGLKVPDGQYYNTYYPGHMLGMPQMLQDNSVTYQDGTKATRFQEAKDVATFLVWAAEPNLEARHRTGIKVMLFLFVFTGCMYAVKRRVWANAH